MTTEIEKVVSAFQTTPVLFVGSGLTRRYLGLPNWEDLLKIFVNRLSPNNPYKYASYKNRAKEQLENGANTHVSKETLLPLTATLIERDFNYRWFSDADFRQVNDPEMLSQIQNSLLSPFKAEISHYIGSLSSPLPEYAEEINDLKVLPENHLSGIITTNYDTFMEHIAPGYYTYIGQNELIFSPIQELGEIYKIHGSVKNPNSIVINQSDYEQFKKHGAYLAAKLLTIFMEYPIIFIGYSLGDENIRSILANITECLNANQLKELQHRFIFISYNHEDTPPEISIIQQNIGNKTIPMTSIRLYNYSDLYKALLRKKRAVPVRLLRLFKNEFYQYALTTTPKPTVMVAPIDDKRIDDQDLMIAIGTKSSLAPRGLVGIKLDRLYQDILFDDLPCSADDVLQYAYPALKRQNTKLPVFKYLSKSLHPHPEVTETQDYNSSFEGRFLTKTLSKNKQAYRNDIPEKSVSAIVARKLPTYKTFGYICSLEPNEIDIDELQTFLLDFFKANIITQNVKPNTASEFRRLVRIYDWLKYGNKNRKPVDQSC